MASNFSRPGVFLKETDLSQVVREAASDVGVIVGAFPRGPVNKRILVTNTRDLITLFGNPDITFGYGAYTALPALETMDKLFITRVQPVGAEHAGMVVNVAGSPSAFTLGVGSSTPDSPMSAAFTETVGTGDGSTVLFGTTLTNFPVTAITDITVDSTSIGPLTVDTGVMPWTIAAPGLVGTNSTLDPLTGVLALELAVAPAVAEDIDINYSAESAVELFSIFSENPGVWANSLKIEVLDIDAVELEFTIRVYETLDGVDIVRETHRVSRQQKLDGFGQSIYLEDVINDNSIYLRVLDNLANVDTVLPDTFGPSFMGGGDDGAAVTSGEVVTGWGLYDNKDLVQVDILMNAGFVTSADFSVQSKMKSLAETRDDCFAILDAPFSELSMNPTTDLTDWRNSAQNFNSSYTALYAPWVEVIDSFNGIRDLPIPPSGFVGQVFARRSKNTEAWYPPAGLNDGVISSGLLTPIRLSENYTDGQRDLIYTAGVNYLQAHQGAGLAVFGDKTQQAKASALDRINVRRLLNVIKRASEAFLKFQLFELNTSNLRAQITEALTAFMDGIQSRQGVTSFQIVCNDTNNTPAVIDNNQLNVDIYIQPTRSINFIQAQVVITRTGVDFQTIIGA